jgi:acyl-coenzyme A synthetase/AMP-(fatty) acid ligase
VEQSVPRISITDMEQALCRVAEIKAARVVASPEGIIQEIHVLALPSKLPKQLVRDIESTLMATFGIAVDHKKISIAQREVLRRKVEKITDEDHS